MNRTETMATTDAMNIPELPVDKEYHIFISYATDDQDVAVSLVNNLERKGILCCFHGRDFMPGEDVLCNMNRAIEKSMYVLMLISEQFVKSKACDHETSVALHARMENTVKIIPVKLQPCEIPAKLKQITYIDSEEGCYDNLHNKIIDKMRERESWTVPESETIKSEAKLMSPELKSIASSTKMFLEDGIPDDVYVYTNQYSAAKEVLNEKNIVVLSGHPGEGKSTMAMKLILDVGNIDKCLRLAQPSDWRYVDIEMFDVIFIDDIFGPGVLDESLVKGWDRFLPEIWKAIQKKALKVIIATRHYILEEARQVFNRSSVFKEEHVQFLSSKELSTDERTLMLRAHMRHNDKLTENNEALIRECVEVSSDFMADLFQLEKKSVLFGFPECVSMFVQNEDLFKSGPQFFGSPNKFFRDCLEDLRKDERKFLALLIMWATPDKVICRSDLDTSYATEFKDNIAKVTDVFGYELKAKLVKTLKRSLKLHTNGFIRYSPASGEYTFNHRVISDMVGLVISEDYPEACLQFTDRDFLLSYITIKENECGKFRFFVEPFLYDVLMETFIRVAAIPSMDLALVDLISLKRGGRRPNAIQPFYETDAGVFFHDAFSDKAFVKKFIKFIVAKERVDQIFRKPVMKMSGYFLSYGFELEEMDICLPAYSLFYTKGQLFIELVGQEILPLESDEVYLALLIAADENHIDVVNALVKKRTTVSEEAIYVAAVRQNEEVLQSLIEYSAGNLTSRGKLEKNNNALMVATKLGKTNSVKLLAPYTNVSLRNDNNLSALDKAIIYNRVEIAKILIDNGATINEKGGKFKRTPLHTASDMGLTEIVTILLQAGSRTDLKDHRGHYPIHCAAIQDQQEVVKMLALHDVNQVKWRIASYGKTSKIKGMTVFHVAVWKDNKELMETLLSVSTDCNVQDWYGRTPIYCAVFEGKEDIVRLLLPFADINIPDKHGYTPLHAAIHTGRSSIIQLLLPNSNVNAQDKFGKTPLHIACREGYCHIVQQLVHRGADPHMTTKKGYTVCRILRSRRPLPLDKLIQLVLNDSATWPEVDFGKCRKIISNVLLPAETGRCVCLKTLNPLPYFELFD